MFTGFIILVSLPVLVYSSILWPAPDLRTGPPHPPGLQHEQVRVPAVASLHLDTDFLLRARGYKSLWSSNPGSQCSSLDFIHCKKHKSDLLKHGLKLHGFPPARSYFLVYPGPCNDSQLSLWPHFTFCCPWWVSPFCSCRRLVTHGQEQWLSAAPEFHPPSALC